MPNNFKIGTMAQYVMRNPFMATAAVFAPLFAKNEDRGYFRTALITTPIVFATGQFVPKMFGGVRDLGNTAKEAVNLLQKSERWTRFDQPNFNDLKSIFNDPAADEMTKERALSSYLVSERKSRDFTKEQRTLDRYFKRRFVKTEDLVGKSQMGDLEALARVGEIDALHATKSRLISNAMHSARRSALTPSEWAGESTGLLPDLDNTALLSTYEQFKNREPFVRTLKNRLREIKDLNYGGTLKQTASSSPMQSATMDIPLDFDNFGFPEEKMFKQQSPEVYRYLEQAKKQNRLNQITITAEKVTSGEVGKVLNVRVTRPRNTKELVIPIVDPATGQVRLNDNAVGVGNYVIGPDAKPYRIDEWAAKMVAEQPGISNELLDEEISAHAYWFAGDPLDSRRMTELQMFGKEGANVLNPQAIKLRSYGAGITKLPLFNVDGKNVAYDQFTARGKVNFIQDLMNTNSYVGMGSEAGIYEGRWQLREAMNLSPWGAPSAEKQDSIWRSVTKEFRLSTPHGVPEEARLGWRSNAWEALTGSPDLPGAKFTVAGISPQDRTLFSELPSTLDELHFNRSQITQKFLERGMNPREATGMFADLEKMYSEGKQGALGYLGSMGETGFVMGPEFSENFQVQSTSKYNMNEIGVQEGAFVHENSVLGFNNGERVVPKSAGKISKIAQDKDGYVVNVNHEMSMQGAKLDIAGIKGMNRVTETNEHFTQMRDLMNNFYGRMEASGAATGDFIPSNVNVLTAAEYFTNKVEPAHAYMGIASDLVTRLNAAGAQDVTADYLAQMSSHGITAEGGQLVIDAAHNLSGDKQAAKRLLELSQVNEEFFKKAGEAIRSAGGYQDPVLTAFVQHGKELGNFMLKNQLPAMGFTWDHSLANVPRFATISHDVETYMGMGGHFAALKAMRGRMQTVSGGDPRQSIDFMKHVMGTSNEALNTIPLSGKFHGRGSLTVAENRANTLFDSSVDAYKQNFQVQLANGKTVPVPGTAAYGAEASMYEPGKYEAKDWQSTLRDMSFETNPEKLDELEGTLMGQYKDAFGLGKGSALRPNQYDPLATPGFLSTAAEQRDPFVARVSEDWLKRVHSSRLRKALAQGDDVVGMIQRQPTNDLFYMKFRLDKTLNGTMDVAVPEFISRSLTGDQDKDLVNSILFDANTRVQDGQLVVSAINPNALTAEEEAAQAGLESMTNGSQAKQLKIWEEIKGSHEVARLNKTFALDGLAAKSEKFAAGIGNRQGVAINRTAGANIGAYSNILTEVNEHMVRNPHLDPEAMQRLKVGFFDIRQAPISARKAHVAFDLEVAMQKASNLRKAVSETNPLTAADKVRSAMMDMAKTLSKDKEHGSEYKYWAEQGAEDLKLWAAGRTEKARLMTQAFTAHLDDSRPAGEQWQIKNLLPQVFEDVEGTLGAVHGGRGATGSASRIGAFSEGMAELGRSKAASVTGKMGKIFAEHGGALALGLGSLAALGVALTPRRAPVATFSRASGNKYRPEERMGVSDHPAGDPMEGQMAPSNPPRRQEAPPTNVRTAVVAPMSSTADLSVRMRAEDQSRAAETARQLAQIPGTGNTNVTVNYRDRTKLRSLRTRERIRDIR